MHYVRLAKFAYIAVAHDADFSNKGAAKKSISWIERVEGRPINCATIPIIKTPNKPPIAPDL